MVIVMQSLPDGSKLKEAALEELGHEKLNHNDGMNRLLSFMDNRYKKEDIYEARDR